MDLGMSSDKMSFVQLKLKHKSKGIRLCPLSNNEMKYSQRICLEIAHMEELAIFVLHPSIGH